MLCCERLRESMAASAASAAWASETVLSQRSIIGQVTVQGLALGVRVNPTENGRQVIEVRDFPRELVAPESVARRAFLLSFHDELERVQSRKRAV